MKQGCLWPRASRPQSRLHNTHGEPEFSQNKAQGDGVHGEEHMQATVCKWKSNRLTLPIMKCEAGVVSLSDFSTVYFYRGSFLVQSVGKQAAGREVGRGAQDRQGFLGRAQDIPHLLGWSTEQQRWSSQRKKVSFLRHKWPRH